MFDTGGLHGGGQTLASGSIYPSSGKFILALEFNADARTLHVFVDGVQKPFCITNIPVPVYMGVCVHLFLFQYLSFFFSI
jgi:hypothetical protein